LQLNPAHTACAGFSFAHPSYFTATFMIAAHPKGKLLKRRNLAPSPPDRWRIGFTI
jgi:hypothetical protein